MHPDWQSLAAGAVVAITALIFLVRMARPRPGGGCCGNCGCKKGKRE
jgi:hypothetical protein